MDGFLDCLSNGLIDLLMERFIKSKRKIKRLAVEMTQNWLRKGHLKSKRTSLLMADQKHFIRINNRLDNWYKQLFAELKKWRQK